MKKSSSVDLDLLDEFSYKNESKIVGKSMLLISLQILLELIGFISATIMVGHFYDGKHSNEYNSNKYDESDFISAIGLASTFNIVAGQVIVWGLTTVKLYIIHQ